MKEEKENLPGQSMEMPHNGEMLKAYIDRKRIYQSALSRSLSIHSETLRKYKKSRSFHTATFWNLCHALKYNFFADLAAALPNTFGSNKDGEPNTKDELIASLQADIEKLQGEKELLMSIVNGKIQQ